MYSPHLILVLLVSGLSVPMPVPHARLMSAYGSSTVPAQNLLPQLAASLVSKPPAVALDPDYERCMGRIAHGINHFLGDNTIPTVLMSSGKGLNDMGDYESCIPPQHYLYIAVQAGAMVSFGAGICVPIECTVSLTSRARPILAEMLSALIGLQIFPEMIQVTSPRELNRVLNQAGPGTTVFVAVISAFVFVGTIATVLDRMGLINGPSACQRFATCFSLGRNIGGLMNTENRIDPRLEVLNGVRVLAMGWVVLGHTFIMLLYGAMTNLDQLFADMLHGYYMIIVKSGTVSVDAFFMLSGFLATLGFLRGLSAARGNILRPILLSYLHRYLRLLPIMLFALAYTVYIQPAMYDTPGNVRMGPAAENCRGQWIYTLLYVNNFVTQVGDSCIGWVWYLFIDMQLFLVVPFVVLLYRKHRRWAIFTILGACVGSFAVQAVIAAEYGFNLSIVKSDDNFVNDSDSKLYVKPYCRLTPYFMGMLLCFLYTEGQARDGSFCTKIRSLVLSRPYLVRYPLYVLGTFTMWLVLHSFYLLDEYPLACFTWWPCARPSLSDYAWSSTPCWRARGNSCLPFWDTDSSIRSASSHTGRTC